MGAVGGLLGLGGGNAGTGFGTNYGTNGGQLANSYNQAQGTIQGQTDLLGALQGQGGLQNQSNVYNQLQGVVSGQGPNPAQAMLNQATGQNVANQAALAAGQRGAASNVGLMNRQAAQTGANLQQQAAGQGASMQAQQALGALGQAGNMANTMAGQQIGQTNQNAATVQNEQGVLQGANNAANSVQGQLANTQLGNQANFIGGGMNQGAAGAGMAAGFFAGGGQVNRYAMGDTVQPTSQSMFGQLLNAPPDSSVPTFSSTPAKQHNIVQPKQQNPMAGAQNITPSQGSPDMGAGTPQQTMVGAHGGNVGSKLKSGGHVPGQAQEKGNSYKNDTVKALLSPGEVVIPRSVMQGKDPVRGAAQFVQSVMAKKKVGK